jgi:DNA-binding transcriptional MerR regulator
MKTIYSTTDIKRASGLSYRQLDYFARAGVLGPSLAKANGKGTRRIYDDQDLMIAKIAGNAKRLGLSAKIIRGLVDFLRNIKYNARIKKETNVILIDKSSFRIVEEQDLTENLLKTSGAIVLSFCDKSA